jgi:hypothetical protein
VDPERVEFFCWDASTPGFRRQFDELALSGENKKVATPQLVGLWRSLGARFHGMEEVVGSIPTRSTNQINHLEAPPSPDLVAFW